MTKTLRASAVGLAGVLIAFVLLYALFSDRLPPRTPRKVANRLTGLHVPYDAEVVTFRDEWNFRGSGNVEVLLRVTGDEFSQLVTAAQKSGYASNLSVSATDTVAASQVPRANGVYRLVRDTHDGGYTLAVLNGDTKELLARFVVP